MSSHFLLEKGKARMNHLLTAAQSGGTIPVAFVPVIVAFLLVAFGVLLVLFTRFKKCSYMVRH